MPDNRIQERVLDRTSGIEAITGPIGAMVIRSPKGPETPVLIGRRDPETIKDWFGVPTQGNDVIEAIAYNAKYPLYVASAVDAADLHGGILVTNSNYEAFIAGEGNAKTGITSAQLAAGLPVEATSTIMQILTATPTGTKDVRVSLSYDSDADLFTLGVQKKRFGKWVSAGEYVFSLKLNTVDGFGRSVYFEDVFEQNPYVKVIVNGDEEDETGIFADYTSNVVGAVTFASNPWVEFGEGSKAVASSASITSAWNQYANKKYNDVRYFLDPTEDTAVPGIFGSLHNYFPYARFVGALPQSLTEAEALDAYGVGNHLAGIDNEALTFYFGSFKERNIHGGKEMAVNAIGSVGVKLADRYTAYFGFAPAGLDENGYGGQITGRAIYDSFHSFSNVQLDTADKNCVNVIELHPSYGLYITSHKTARPSKLSTVSFVANADLLATIRKHNRENVLVYQAFKLNDAAHRLNVKTKIESYLAPIYGLGLLNPEGSQVICDESNNTADVFARNDFVTTVVLETTTYSERVSIDYIYKDATQTIEEVINF